jgi:hypothetical protein
MALRGSLVEFELPDIFQLIANDGKTGQLVLYEKDREGFVIFFHGAIISAGNSVFNLQTIIFKYLTASKHYSEPELNELLYLCQGEMKLFTQELVNKGYLSKDELSLLARMSIEDLACSLFFWENGRYRFDSLDNVDDYTAGGVKLSSDAVTMEAMRRLDEWKRMKSAISGDVVFVRVRSPEPGEQNPTPLNPITDPAGFISSCLDGVSSVSRLCDLLFFTEYRIYETLFELWQTNKIAPLKVSHPLRKVAPASQTAAKPSWGFKPVIASFIAAHGIVALMCGFGYLLNHLIFSNLNLERQKSRDGLIASAAENKIRIAALHYHGLFGSVPPNILQLKDSGLILSKDVSNYPVRVQNDLKNDMDSLEKK